MKPVVRLNRYGIVGKILSMTNRICHVIESCTTTDQLNTAIDWYSNIFANVIPDKFGDQIYTNDYISNELKYYRNIIISKVKTKSEEIYKNSVSNFETKLENIVKDFISRLKFMSESAKNDIKHKFLYTNEFDTFKEALNRCSNSTVAEFIILLNLKQIK